MVKLSKTSPLREARKDFSGNLIRTNILQQEIKYLKSCVQETDCGHILTEISVLEDRVKALKGEEIDDPFLDGSTS